MTDEMQRNVTDTLNVLARVATPLLLVVALYFIKPLVDIVPVLQRQIEVMNMQQQNVVNTTAQISVKQESLGAELVNVRTKVEVVNEKVNRLERKLDN